MRAQLHDAPFMQHGDAVSIADGGDAVRNEDCGAVAHDFTEVVKDCFFRVSIDAGKSVIQYENTRVAYDGARNRATLFLSAGKRNTALTYQRFVAFGEAFNIASDVGGGGRALHLIFSRTESLKRKVS